MSGSYRKPKLYELTPGDYKIDVTPLKLERAGAKTVRATVTRGATVETSVAFP